MESKNDQSLHFKLYGGMNFEHQHAELLKQTYTDLTYKQDAMKKKASRCQITVYMNDFEFHRMKLI